MLLYTYAHIGALIRPNLARVNPDRLQSAMPLAVSKADDAFWQARSLKAPEDQKNHDDEQNQAYSA